MSAGTWVTSLQSEVCNCQQRLRKLAPFPPTTTTVSVDDAILPFSYSQE